MLRGSLRGVLIGNPHIWCDSMPSPDRGKGTDGFVQSWVYHGLLSFSLYC